MRLAVMTRSAEGNTSSPFIVTTRAPIKATDPAGAGRGIVNAIRICSDAGTRGSSLFAAGFASAATGGVCVAASFSRAFRARSSANAMAVASATRWKTGPSVHVRLRPASAQAT
jgi:hypothetical protein